MLSVIAGIAVPAMAPPLVVSPPPNSLPFLRCPLDDSLLVGLVLTSKGPPFVMSPPTNSLPFLLWPTDWQAGGVRLIGDRGGLGEALKGFEDAGLKSKTGRAFRDSR